MASDVSSTISPRPPAGLYAAYGLHLGLLLVAVSAVLSRPPAGLGLGHVTVLVLVGLALLIWAALERSGGSSSAFRAATALGAALLLGLARTPRLTLPAPDEPHLSGAMRWAVQLFSQPPLTLAAVGALLACLCWFVMRASGGRALIRREPFQVAVIWAGLMLVAFSLLLYLVLQPLYGISGRELGTWAAVMRAVYLVALLVPTLAATGGPLVRRAPAVYLGLALLAAAGLDLLRQAGGLP